MTQMIEKNTKHGMGVSLVLLSSLMFGSYGIWSRLMGSSDFGVFYQGWSRALIIILILTPIIFYKREVVKIEKQDRGWLAVFLLFTSATQAPIYYAFNHMDIGTATLLFFVTILITMYIVGAVFLNEKLTKVKIVSFAFALIGMYLVFSISITTFSVLAVSMAILNGVASGGEISFSKKLSSKYSALYLTWLSWLIIILINALFSFALGEIQHLPSLDVVWLYQIGYVIAGIIGFWAVIQGLRYIETGIGGLLGLMEIVFSIAFGILVFKEVLSPRVVLGGLVIVIAAAVPHLVDLIKKD